MRRKIFKAIGEAINSIYGKIAVFAVTLTFLGIGIWGLTELETKFESSWFLPQESYIAKWERASADYFSNAGKRVTVYVTDVNFSTDISKIGQFVTELEKSDTVVSSINTFYPSFYDYVLEYYGTEINSTDLETEAEIYEKLGYYLWSPGGNGQNARYQASFDFGTNLTCDTKINDIKLTMLDFVHPRFNSTSQHLDGMDKIYNLIEDLKFSNSVFPMTQEYANWETEQVIQGELYRNIGLSMLCVFITMLILLADIWGSTLVMVCVSVSLIDVMGFMHFWGLTIDVVTSIIVIISIGLCVDYSAHIAHAFLTSQGSRSQRSIMALQNVGPAVLNGGVSTFLAMVLLAASKSYVFTVFFKVLTLVIFFGLFHGLVFFPALLGLLGPSAYSHDGNQENNDKPNVTNASVENSTTKL